VIWVFAVVVVLALGGVALVAAGRGEPMVEEYDDRPDALVPAEGPVTAADLRRVRFSLTFRGYRMSEVDALLDRLAVQLEPQPDDAPAPVEPITPHDPADPDDRPDAADPAWAPDEASERSRDDEPRP
jgi:DivIVA domain-containing protein